MNVRGEGRAVIRDQNWAAREIDGETVLIPIRAGAVDLKFLFVLNPTATFIWQQLDVAPDTDALAAELAARFAVDVAQAAVDVAELVESFREAGLVKDVHLPERKAGPS